MSNMPYNRRIRAQASTRDADVMGFVLDVPINPGGSVQFDEVGQAPLAQGLLRAPGVARIEVSEATIWVRKETGADWAVLKPAVAAAIRRVLDETDTPLEGDRVSENDDPDAALLKQVKELLDRQVNPSIAAHGGQISAERVEGGAVYLQMSGGCQGCAASSITLRNGVERMLRAALPQIREIVDVTDHAAGSNPFYSQDAPQSPVLNRMVPEGVIRWDGGQVTVDPDYLAPKLGLTADALRVGLRQGDVTGVTEAGEGRDEGKTRIIMRSTRRAWAAEILSDGSAREIPPPRETGAALARERELTDRVRALLSGLPSDRTPVTYGSLARALGLWTPGAVGRVTRALETTMRQDAAAGRPFIAARVVSRGRDKLPAKGFFELAQSLSRGHREGESDQDFHLREVRWLEQSIKDGSDRVDGSTQTPADKTV